MNHCKTCAHWEDYLPEETGLGLCGSPKFHTGDAELRGVPSDAVAVQYNDEGYGILTGPEFGCIHHKEKP